MATPINDTSLLAEVGRKMEKTVTAKGQPATNPAADLRQTRQP